MKLELMALRWLRFDKRCRVALFERSPRQAWSGEPDVLGVNDRRYLFEIEIKRSVQDFRANKRKQFHQMRDAGVSSPKYPRYFWFLVPPQIVEAVTPIVPKWAGLLCGPGDDDVQCLHSVIPAPANPESEPLTTKECVRLAQMMANQIWSFASTLASWEGHRYEGWISDYSI